MRDGSSDDESPPPVSCRGRAAAKKPESEMTTVEKHVARMLAANAAVEMETARQAHRAETLRRTGESALVALGDLDVDSDSETEDDTSAGFTGKARREVRCRRRVSRHEDENEDEHEDVFRVSIRALSARELGMTYAWMRRDQARYENAVKFWDNASSSIQAAWEETDFGGGRCLCVEFPKLSRARRVLPETRPRPGRLLRVKARRTYRRRVGYQARLADVRVR